MYTRTANFPIAAITPAAITAAVTRRCSALLWALAVVALSSHARADDTETADPVARVARISYLKGDVYVQPVAAQTWTDAVINRPLTSGDQLWTASRGRSELQVGSTALQLNDNTQIKLLELSDEVLQVQLTSGTVNVRVRALGKRDTVEIDTPNAAITVMEAGTYRVDVDADSTVLQVREGSADASGQRQSFTIDEDEQLTLRGDRRLSASYDDVARLDEFDRWATERNERADRARSARYVSSDVIGYEDLDDYGAWRWSADFGYVWTPDRIAADWAPYRYGHWIWIAPWGWTWVDDSPWGFAPFHYGRWTQISNRWCWVPGARTARAVYAPALVAWIGSPSLSVSISVGPSVGWIPLGPRDIYRPVYRSSHNYVLNVNLSSGRLNQDEFERGYRRDPRDLSYSNRGAASVVPAEDFGKSRPVHTHLLRVDGTRLQVNNQKPDITPDRSALLGSERARTTPVISTSADPAGERNVVVKRQPQPITRSNQNPGVEPTQDRGDQNDGRLTTPRVNNDALRVATPPATRRVERDTPASDSTPRSNVGNRESQQDRAQAQPQTRDDTSISRGTRSTVTTPYIRQTDRDAASSGPSPAVTAPVATPSPATPSPMTREPAESPRYSLPERGVRTETPTDSTERSQHGPAARTPQTESRPSPAATPQNATPAATSTDNEDPRRRNRNSRDQDIR